MKKVLVLMMSLMLCLGMAACGSKDEGSDSGASAEKDVPKVEKTVDAVAEALGLTDEKQEKAFEMVGATDGAGYGDVEIYKMCIRDRYDACRYRKNDKLDYLQRVFFSGEFFVILLLHYILHFSALNCTLVHFCTIVQLSHRIKICQCIHVLIR